MSGLSAIVLPQEFQYLVCVGIKCPCRSPTDMPVETIRSVRGTLGATKKNALESDRPQVLHYTRQECPPDSATLILRQQREHDDFTRVLVAKAVANDAIIVHAQMTRKAAGLNLLAPRLSSYTERSKTSDGNSVLTS
jgi:hypothetical protein